MSDIKKVAEGLGKLGDKFPYDRELLIMEGMEWVNGPLFKAFHDQFPQQAAWLKSFTTKNSVLARVLFARIGSLIGKAAGVTDPKDIKVARIADFLVAAQNMIRLGPDGEGAPVIELQQKLLELDHEQSLPLIAKLGAMNPDVRQRVLKLIRHLEPTQIANLLTMEDETLGTLLALGDAPAVEAASKTADPLLASLKAAGEKLKAAAMPRVSEGDVT